jgi:hypothetical protein
MAVKITTLSVHPQRANRLREFRDEEDLPSIDAAVEELLERGEV